LPWVEKRIGVALAESQVAASAKPPSSKPSCVSSPQWALRSYCVRRQGALPSAWGDRLGGQDYSPATGGRSQSISGPEKFWSAPQKDFFNTVGAKRTSGRMRGRPRARSGRALSCWSG